MSAPSSQQPDFPDLPELPELPDLPEKSGKSSRGAKKLSAGSERSRPVRALILAGKIFSLVVLSVLTLCLACLLAIQLKADFFTEQAMQMISERAGVNISFEDAGVRLFPFPGVKLDGVEIRKDEEVLVRTKTLIVAPNLVRLLSGRPELEEIILDEPTIFLSHAWAHALFNAAPSASESGNTADLPLHCRLIIHDGQLQAIDEDGSVLRMLGLNAHVTAIDPPLNAFDSIFGKASVSALQVRTPAWAAQVLDFSVQGSFNPRHPLTKLSLKVRGRGAVTPLSLGAVWTVNLRGSRDGLNGSGDITGQFSVDGQVIPWGLAGSLEPASDAASELPCVGLLSNDSDALLCRLKLERIAIGDDLLRADTQVTLSPANPAAAGRLYISRVSLTRWLDFARDLCPGLQRALDDITNGSIDFYIDSKRLICPRVTATSGGATFSGEGGVADWSHPNIFLGVASSFVKLTQAIPEAGGNMPEPLDFGHKALTSLTAEDLFPEGTPAEHRTAQTPSQAPVPLPAASEQEKAENSAPAPASTAAAPAEGTSAPAEEEDWGLEYDIRLGAAHVAYGDVDLEETLVVIIPGVNSRGEDSCRLDMKAAVCGGSVTGSAFFSGDEELEYEFDVTSNGVNMAKLREALDFLPINKGTGQARVRATSKGGEIDRFLGNLKGTVSVSLAKAALKSDELFSPFSADITLSLASGAFKNTALGLNGKWDIKYRAEAGWNADAVLQGQIWFGGEGEKAGVNTENLTTTLKAAKLEKLCSFLKAQDVLLSATGKAFFDSARPSAGLKGSHLEAPGLSCDGVLSVVIDQKNPQLKASLSKAQLKTVEFTRLFTGKNADWPENMRQASLKETELEVGRDAVRLKKFSAAIAEIPVSGSLTASNFSGTPNFDFDLSLGDVELDPFIGEGDKKDKAAEDKDQDKKYDLSFMKEFNAKGTLKARSLLVKKLRTHGLTVPAVLRNGHLDCQNVSATINDGALAASGSADFDKGVSFQSRFLLLGADLGGLMRNRGAKGEFSGRMDVRAELASKVTGPNQLVRNLNGTLSFTCHHGGYQQAEEEKGKSKPIEFDRASVTAVIKNGVLTTDDFLLQGEDIKLSGKGEFNLDKQTMDVNLNADMRNLPVVPMRLYGTFDKPKTSIGGMIILNTIGALFKGLFGAVGGLFKGIFGIFL